MHIFFDKKRRKFNQNGPDGYRCRWYCIKGNFTQFDSVEKFDNEHHQLHESSFSKWQIEACIL